MNLATAVDAERRRISAELHDRVGPSLTAVALNLRLIEERHRAVLGAELLALLHESQQLLSQSVGEIRELSGALRPARLEYAGLEAALADFAQQFRFRSGIDARVQVHIGAPGSPARRLPAGLEWLLYRIVEEALGNCARHAAASQVTVDLRCDGAIVHLQISDNGVGFDPEAIAQSQQKPGLGLLEIRERVEQARGSFWLRSQPGAGTHIAVTVPVTGAGDAPVPAPA